MSLHVLLQDCLTNFNSDAIKDDLLLSMLLGPGSEELVKLAHWQHMEYTRIHSGCLSTKFHIYYVLWPTVTFAPWKLILSPRCILLHLIRNCGRNFTCQLTRIQRTFCSFRDLFEMKSIGILWREKLQPFWNCGLKNPLEHLQLQYWHYFIE